MHSSPRLHVSCALLALLLLPAWTQAGGPPPPAGSPRAVRPPLPPRYDTGKPALASHPAWEIQRVDAPKVFAQMEDRSLALDGAGRPCISYYDASNRDLMFACRTGGRYHTFLPALGEAR